MRRAKAKAENAHGADVCLSCLTLKNSDVGF
jgi:hypothetical protein